MIMVVAMGVIYPWHVNKLQNPNLALTTLPFPVPQVLGKSFLFHKIRGIIIYFLFDGK